MNYYLSTLIQSSESSLREKSKRLDAKLIELDKMPLNKASLVIGKDNSTIILIDKNLQLRDKNLLTLYHLFQSLLYKENIILSREIIMAASLYYIQKKGMKITYYKSLLLGLKFSFRRLYMRVMILEIANTFRRIKTKVKL